MKVDDNETNFSSCTCEGCPSHSSCMKEKKEKLYCAKGKSGCPVTESGCICGECPVASQYQLNRLYFCEK